ncbi:MAG: hypothetical protein AAF770_03525 [Bacteroidota bacterium]
MNKKKREFSHKIRQKRLGKATYTLFDFFGANRSFLLIVVALVIIAGIIHPYTSFAMTFGFILSSYGVIANDSIQTLGLFITANIHRRPTWLMWFFISFIFIITALGSWLLYHGDVSYNRLAVQGLIETPSQISFLQLVGPILILVLTRMRIPVSTTFFLLNAFSSHPSSLGNMVIKSILGYSISFTAAFVGWFTLIKLECLNFQKKPSKLWLPLHWITIGLLWMAWLMQDTSNMVVFLPRKMSLYLFLAFITFICFLLGVLFYSRGGRIQDIVDKKTGVTDIRAATIITFFYMGILFLFTFVNHVPMSTTFVFIGLLGGRELAKGITQENWKNKIFKTIFLIRRDLQYAFIGLFIAIMLTLLVNPTLRIAINSYIKNIFLR